MQFNGYIADIERIFQITRIVNELPFINWSEPNFITSPNEHFIPNDPMFNNQWHLHNTGQNGAAVDADIDAPEGWDISRGIDTVIAIYDGGIDLAHEDLRIWMNTGETGNGKETNGIDDDGNGYIDDYQGWDFTDNDNDPGPVDEPGRFGFKDNHGTSVAGVAGAIGNNSIGVTGSAQGAEIIPVRMNSGTCSDFANAMRYAGKYADVVNNSWSIDACESNLNSAISDVVNGTISGARRGTKGTPVLFASGNNASGWIKFTLTGFPDGTYTFRWRFSKDANTSAGYDTVWLDDIRWPGGGITDFEAETIGNIPNGFVSGGSATWTVVNDGIHARGASGKSVKAGTITHSQETYMDITRAVGAGDLTFWAWVSSEQDYDYFDFYVNGTRYFHFTPGQYGHFNDVGYPASNPDTIAVGASNDGGISGEEERSDYSQFGITLDVIAPSSGGGQGITTTDRTGNKGYDQSDYYSSFGGTSSSTPLVAGIVASIIADNPALTSGQVRTILREGADKIGPYAYSGGRNDFYGYGRINLFNSLCPDSDGDGYTICANDCDDGNLDINPGIEEVCDNIDNNCDGNIDEGFNLDGDAYKTCEGDCDDTDPAINPDTYWYQDSDEDGYGNRAISFKQCTQPGPLSYVLNKLDFDDNDSSIGPPTRIDDSTPLYYLTLQEAYDAAIDGDTIQCVDVTFIEDLLININKAIILKGGYDGAYSTQIGNTTLNGNIDITNGTLTIENFILQ
jgi:subtilisin family serine protease